MPIKVKTRKILWSKSGNRCAICKRCLVQKIASIENDFIVGEECHIISSKENGPRGREKTLNDYDSYENLILLCAIDHKLIDEFPETYTTDIIYKIKVNHENWIETAIEKDLEEFIKDTNNIDFFEEITTPTHIDSVVNNAHFFFFDLNSITDDNLSIEVSELFENLRDYSDIDSDIELSIKTRYLIDFINTIKKFNESGIKFFGKGLIREYTFMNIPKSEYKIAVVIAFQVDINPDSIRNGKLMIKIPDDFTPKF